MNKESKRDMALARVSTNKDRAYWQFDLVWNILSSGYGVTQHVGRI